MNKFGGCNVHHGDYSLQYNIVYLKAAERDLKTSHQNNNNNTNINNNNNCNYGR